MSNVVRTLIIANVIAYFVQQTGVLPTSWLAFYPRYVFVQPWSVVTYMFLHGGVMHILFNMLGLWFFGTRVEMRLGSRRFTMLYFIAGIFGALTSMIFAWNAAVIGASAGVFGVMLAFAEFWPNQPIYIWGVLPVPARIMVIGSTILAIWSGFGGVGDGTAHFAHLGGFIGAWIYLRIVSRKAAAFKSRAEAPTPVASTKLGNWKDIDVARIHEVNRAEVNRLIDKVQAGGVGSLSPQEQQFLSNFVPTDRTPPVS